MTALAGAVPDLVLDAWAVMAWLQGQDTGSPLRRSRQSLSPALYLFAARKALSSAPSA